MANDKEKGDIEVHYKKDADKRTRALADRMEFYLNSPLFARLVREAVEEMCLEGRIVYDIDSDELKDPEDQVKDWSSKMEREVWSKGIKGKRGRRKAPSKDLPK